MWYTSYKIFFLYQRQLSTHQHTPIVYLILYSLLYSLLIDQFSSTLLPYFDIDFIFACLVIFNSSTLIFSYSWVLSIIIFLSFFKNTFYVLNSKFSTCSTLALHNMFHLLTLIIYHRTLSYFLFWKLLIILYLMTFPSTLSVYFLTLTFPDWFHFHLKTSVTWQTHRQNSRSKIREHIIIFLNFLL